MAISHRLKTRNTTLADLIAVGKVRHQLAQLALGVRPSEITRQLRLYPPRVLLTARILEEGNPQAAILDRFFGEWRHVRTAVTGHDLRTMGLTPSPLYSRLLERLLDARLDGEVQSEHAERALLDHLLAAGSYGNGQ
jgi:hypothetical protein